MPAPETAQQPDPLVQGAIDGERGAFGALYERHVDAVYRYVRFRVGDDAAAADLTQDVFVSAFRGIGRLLQPERFGAWLIRIAHNCVLNDRRARARHAAVRAWPDGGDEEDLDMAADDDDPADQVALHMTTERITAATERLTEVQQEVLALRFVAGLSLAETSAILGRSDDAVKKLQRRALAALRRQLVEGEALR